MRHLIGIDGGGTRTTLAVADESGREIVRRTGPAGLVDPRRPAATAEMLAELAREALAAAAAPEPVAVLCAGLAGVGNAAEREAVRASLARAGIAERVLIRSDGEVALHGALGGRPGILLIAGTGSVGYGRAEDGRVARCGGWGLIVGDEGSGYLIGRVALTAALRSVDGRGAPTELLPRLLEAIGLSTPEAVPPWVGRAEKAEIAALAVHVLEVAAGGDAVADAVVREQAGGLAAHAGALVRRLGPWTQPTPVVLHGGVARDRTFGSHMERALAALELPLVLRPAAADAVAGAVHVARDALGSDT
ncbi:MAG TPA: BadF/BadG/BcrA/BcrD ATPase family protein [Longimicrobiaceae bacterium]|nr:BadF/BadG/BcrA/BcrD ATPase family protein [Longimicrobiaceae bacterium]